MLISVILPTYNRAPTLDRAIRSVLGQSHNNWELIVVDDGSTDSTEDLLKSWSHESKIKTLKTSNMGVSAARNHGVRASQGELIAFLDSDDEWLPHKLEKQVRLMGRENRKWCHGEEIWIRRGQRVQPRKVHQKGGGWQFLRALELCCISPSAVVLERSLWDLHGGFREDFPVCEDYDLWLKISLLEPISFCREPVVIKYGGHDDQLSRKLKAMDYFRAKSLHRLLSEAQMNPDLRAHVSAQLSRRLSILEAGYKKHGHIEKLQEIQSLRGIELSGQDLSPIGEDGPHIAQDPRVSAEPTQRTKR